MLITALNSSLVDFQRLGLWSSDTWNRTETLSRTVYTCGFCGNRVGSQEGYSLQPRQPYGQAFIRICPTCLAPSFFTRSGEVFPAAAPGKPINGLPQDVQVLYEEARASAGAGAHTSSVLTCRKILMHVGVQEQAETDRSFLYYVEYLSDNGFVPPKGKPWVDYIRTRGNEANHDIVVMNAEDSRALITFVEMLLRFIYEFPGMVPSSPAAGAP